MSGVLDAATPLALFAAKLILTPIYSIQSGTLLKIDTPAGRFF
jgi:hypothetical protein